jgi:hypothetical protein
VRALRALVVFAGVFSIAVAGLAFWMMAGGHVG